MHEVNCLHTKANPVISIGMPIWNCEDTVGKSIQSIVNQDFTNWCLLISDNHSSDSTFEIAQRFADSDDRITLVRQSRNIGGWQNFQYVLNNSNRRYFKFHAGDDVLSPNYLTECIDLLERDSNFVGACTPDGWDWEVQKNLKVNDFSFTGTQSERLAALCAKCWRSNGVFYGVFHKYEFEEAISSDIFLSQLHILDWLILARLLKVGGIARTSNGLMTLGSKGASNTDPLQWYKQLDGTRNKAFPYQSFYRLFVKGSQKIEIRTKIEVRKWILLLYFNHYKGLFRLKLSILFGDMDSPR